MLSPLITLAEARSLLALLALGTLLTLAPALLPRETMRPPPTPPLRLDPNRATRRALTALPGIGSARANAIVLGRPYQRLKDLDGVLGSELSQRLKPWLFFPGERAAEEPAKAR